MNKYSQIRQLGEGSYGQAILVRRRADMEQFVAKKLRATPKEMEMAQAEANMLKVLHHSNVVGYVESFVENFSLWIIMEYADGGDLHSRINHKKQRFVSTQYLKIH